MGFEWRLQLEKEKVSGWWLVRAKGDIRLVRVRVNLVIRG